MTAPDGKAQRGDVSGPNERRQVCAVGGCILPVGHPLPHLDPAPNPPVADEPSEREAATNGRMTLAEVEAVLVLVRGGWLKLELNL